jgi:hypothetical protein
VVELLLRSFQRARGGCVFNLEGVIHAVSRTQSRMNPFDSEPKPSSSMGDHRLMTKSAEPPSLQHRRQATSTESTHHLVLPATKLKLIGYLQHYDEF